jgi:hypothetical protein
MAAPHTNRRKSPEITENRRKSELQADLRGSLILPPTVKSSCAGLGETLFGLALRHDTTIDALKRANALLGNNLDLHDGTPPT